MGEHFRHHRASREIIFVPVPFESGSPKSARDIKPGKYPAQRREHWNGPPRRESKGDALVRFLDQCRRQEESVREMLRPRADLFYEWLTAGRVEARDAQVRARR